MSTILGSLSSDTSCVARFNWFGGVPNNVEGVPATEQEFKVNLLLKGYENNEKKNTVLDNLKSADQSHQKHLYLNYRQYVGKYVS